ncbi:MAG: aquaporin [Bacteroidia bacterium]|nr:aquaporin [Bacteroidia bacterium]
MKNYLTEFIGTFFLVLTIGLATGSGSILAPVAMGATLMVMTYMGRHISGAHYNPAVTLAVYIRGKIEVKEAGIFWVSQILGATVAGFLVGMLVQDDAFVFRVTPANSASIVEVLLTEVIFTFGLVLVFLNVSTTPPTENNSYFGLAIGFTYLAGVFAGGPVSGGVFNPAVGLGPNLAVQHFAPIWIYAVGPLAGGALAGFVSKFQNPVS